LPACRGDGSIGIADRRRITVSFTLSFMGANFWARDVSWQAPDFESIGRSTRARFEPLTTYRAAMDELLDVIASFDVEAIDLWVGHLDPAWATEDHVAIAVESISAHGLVIASFAGGFGADLQEFERTCEIAVGLGRPILGGSTAAWDHDRAGVLRLLEQHELRLAFENHPQERTPADMIRKIGDAPPELVGTAVDTGWWGTNGYDAALAIEELSD
jgi:sugar phosphate isomerase/epimerase